MSEWLNNLVNPHLIDLKPYESARRLFSGGNYFLNANESPFANNYEIDASRFNRYPDCQPEAVVKGYADYAGLDVNNVIVTRGADEGIELLIRAFCEPGKDNIVICPPTYGMYAISAETCNVGVQKVQLKPDFSLDIDGLKQVGDTNLVFICSPNNPTGTSVPREQIKTVLEYFAGKALVVVDEAYIEFDDSDSWASEIAQYDNLVVLRTLSKAFGLAGLRCGFTLAQPTVIQCLMKVIAPYPMPEPVAQIAAQALSETGLQTISEQVATMTSQRTALQQALRNIPSIELVGDAQANFVLFRCEHKDALMQHLVNNGMLIRDQSKQVGLNNCLRATVGNEQEQSVLLSLIESFYANRSAA